MAGQAGYPGDLTETVVTTMLILQSDGRVTHRLDDYFANFAKIAATGLPIVLYLDRAHLGRVNAPNVTVVPITITELDLWRDTRGHDLRLPATRNVVKDTADYLLIVNAKTELVRRTIELGLPYRQHAFLDFGIFHIIGDAARAQERIRALNRFPAERVVIPGCHPPGADALDWVNWRFSGSFFYGPAEAVTAFAIAHQNAVRALLPRLTWEVNVWARIEQLEGWPCRWYYGNHDDTILDYPLFTPAGG